MTKIKICCISNLMEAELAIKYGADALGLVSEMPSGPGVIDDDTIEEISTSFSHTIDTFLLTSKRSVEEIVKQHHRFKTTTIQIVDSLLEGTHSDLRSALPGIKLVQVIHVGGEESIHEAIENSKTADGLLLDSGNQKLLIKELGGTGRTHNWEISRKIVESVTVPVFLAGGLNPLNIEEAIKSVRPYGVDICSGVRSNGKLDELKLRDYISRIKNF
jgi:phosphoribosylanthranilate isomerase